MADPPQARQQPTQRLADRFRLGRDRRFEHNRTRAVDHANRGLFRRNVQSSKIFHGRPPLALGAHPRPRISTVILGDSRFLRISRRKYMRKPNYAGTPNWAGVSVRVLHVSSMVCSRSISGSLLLWRISGGTASFLCKGQQPVMVEPRCDLVRWPSRRRGILPPTRYFDEIVHVVGASSVEPGRSAQRSRPPLACQAVCAPRAISSAA